MIVFYYCYSFFLVFSVFFPLYFLSPYFFFLLLLKNRTVRDIVSRSYCICICYYLCYCFLVYLVSRNYIEAKIIIKKKNFNNIIKRSIYCTYCKQEKILELPDQSLYFKTSIARIKNEYE